MRYDVKMQQEEIKDKFNNVLGQLFRDMRQANNNMSISKIAREYELDRGNLSKLERGINGCNMFTAYKLCEASGIKFSEFAIRFEEKLGKNFTTIDE